VKTHYFALLLLHVGGAKQSSVFSQLLLYETNIIYTGLLENSEIAYNNQRYDYQIIVPDNTNQSSSSETYYFYIELI